jgi:hypothetical protein
MSSSPFPDPRTTNFIPKAWDYTIRNRYATFIVTYPIAQNNLITFLTAVYLTTRTALTQWADTAYATSEIVAWTAANVPALLPVAQTWANLQYYFGGIAVNAINPTTTGGTLLIGHSSTQNTVYVDGEDSRSTVLHLGDGNTSSGAIHINNGTGTSGGVEILNGTGSTGTITMGSSTSTTTLNCPLTPLYSPPVAVGKIGTIVPITFITNTADNSGGKSLRSVTLPSDGVWLMVANVLGVNNPPTYSYPSNFYGLSVSSGLNSSGTQVGIQKTGQQVSPKPPVIYSSSFFTTSRLTAATYYLNHRNDGSYIISEVNWIVVRIA